MRALKILIIAFVLVGLSLLTIGWVMVAERGPELAEEAIFMATGHPARVREISLAPSRLVLAGVSIGNGLTCDRIEIDAPWQTFFQSRPQISRVVFQSPCLTVKDARRIPAETSFLNAPAPSSAAQEGQKARVFVSGFTVDKIIVRDGRITILFPEDRAQTPYELDRVQVVTGRAGLPLKGKAPLAFRLEGDIRGVAGCLQRIRLAMDGEWSDRDRELRGAVVLDQGEDQVVRSRLVLNGQGLKMKGRINLSHLCLFSETPGLEPLKALLFQQSALGKARVVSDFTYEAPLTALKGGRLRLKGEIILPDKEKEPLAE